MNSANANPPKVSFGKAFEMLVAAAALCALLTLVGCSSSSSQAASSEGSASTSGASVEAAASAEASAEDSASASAAVTSSNSASATGSNSAAATSSNSASAEEIDYSDPALLDDLDEFRYDTVTVYAPKAYGLFVDESVDVPEDRFWRNSSHVAIMIDRKPVSYYTTQYTSKTAERILSSEEEFQKFMIEAAEEADTKTPRTTETINGRYYQYYDSDNGNHNVWTILVDDENVYWIYYACFAENKDTYHDIMVQLIGKATIDSPR